MNTMSCTASILQVLSYSCYYTFGIIWVFSTCSLACCCMENDALYTMYSSSVSLNLLSFNLLPAPSVNNCLKAEDIAMKNPLIDCALR